MRNEFALEAFGQFNKAEIHAIVDTSGNYWFTQDVIADALEIDRSTLTHIRQNHPGEFREHVDYTNIVWEGKRRVVYSEEGFLTVCDMSTSENSYRLRKWMRQQFRVKQRGQEVIVHHKSVDTEDLTDLDKDLMIVQQLVNAIAEDRRRIKRIGEAQVQLDVEQRQLSTRVEVTEQRLQQWEDGAKLKPGEMTAVQLAQQCRWISDAGGPHNTAVILAAVNANFDQRGLMETRREEGPGGIVVNVTVFPPAGVAKFINEIDSQYNTGATFTVVPSARALQLSYKNKRNVRKF